MSGWECYDKLENVLFMIFYDVECRSFDCCLAA